MMGKHMKGLVTTVLVTFLLAGCASSPSQISPQRLENIKTIDLVVSEQANQFFFSEDAGTVGVASAVGGLLGGFVAIGVSGALSAKWASGAEEILAAGNAYELHSMLLEAVGEQYQAQGYEVSPRVAMVPGAGGEATEGFARQSDKDLVVLMFPSYRLLRGYALAGEMRMIAYAGGNGEMLGSYFNEAGADTGMNTETPDTIRNALLANEEQKLRTMFDRLIQRHADQSVKLLGSGS